MANEKFCVEYADEKVQVRWHPGSAEATALADKWFADALPRKEKVPQTMLRTLIGSPTGFSPNPRYDEKTVELRSKLAGGGDVTLMYYSDKPLSENEQQEGLERLRLWISSYLRSD